MAAIPSKPSREWIENYEKAYRESLRHHYGQPSSSFDFPSLREGSRQWRSPLGGVAKLSEEQKK
jgi:hypothetical protein